MEALWQLFGRFHPVLVHFPIALLLVGAALRLLRREDRTGVALIHLGAIGAVASLLAGFSWEDQGHFQGKAHELIELHERLGMGATVTAVVASVLAFRWKERRLGVQNGVLVLAALLVGAAGHFGGVSVYGEDHLTLTPAKKAKTGIQAEAVAIVAPKPGEEVDFAAHVQPIFERACYRCHDERKRKGGLRLDKKKYFLQGGDGGPSVVPGKPIASKLFQLVSLPKDHEDYMPSKGKPLQDAEVEIIGKWIEQGAVWPDDPS